MPLQARHGAASSTEGHAGEKRKPSGSGRTGSRRPTVEYSCKYDKYYFGDNKVLDPPSDKELEEIRNVINEEWFDSVCKAVEGTYITEEEEPQIKIKEAIIPRDLAVKLLNAGTRMLSRLPNVVNMDVPLTPPKILPPNPRSNKSLRLPKHKDLKKLVVVGDTHGTFDALRHIIKTEGFPSPDKGDSIKYVFNGDYVDRGAFGVEIFLCCLAMFITNPECVCMLRGNHETKETSSSYTLIGEVEWKYGKPQGKEGVATSFRSEDQVKPTLGGGCCDPIAGCGTTESDVFTLFCEAFKMLPIACIIDKEVLVLHGGIPARPGSSVQTLQRLCRNRDPYKQEDFEFGLNDENSEEESSLEGQVVEDPAEGEEDLSSSKDSKEHHPGEAIGGGEAKDKDSKIPRITPSMPKITNRQERMDYLEIDFESPEQMHSCDPLQDILWSDPTDDHPNIAFNSARMASIMYGKRAVEKFLDLSNEQDAISKKGEGNKKPLLLRSIIRSHSCVPGGYLVQHNGKTTTVFSVPRYQGGLYEGDKDKGAYMIFARERPPRSSGANPNKLLRTFCQFMVCPNAYMDNQPVELMCPANRILRTISEELDESEFFSFEEEEEEESEGEGEGEETEDKDEEHKREKHEGESKAASICCDGSPVVTGELTLEDPVFECKYVEAYDGETGEVVRASIPAEVDIPVLLALIHDRCIDEKVKYWQYSLPGRRPSNRQPPIDAAVMEELIKRASDRAECIEVKKKIHFGYDELDEDDEVVEWEDDNEESDDWDEDEGDDGDADDDDEEDFDDSAKRGRRKKSQKKPTAAPSKKRSPK